MNTKHKLVPAPKARSDYFGGISAMCEWRWRKAEILPEPININGRNFYRESDLIAAQERQARKSETRTTPPSETSPEGPADGQNSQLQDANTETDTSAPTRPETAVSACYGSQSRETT